MMRSIEIVCEDCGEVMLVDPGDKINYRLVDDNNNVVSIDNLEQNVSFKFLCAVCNKKEDPNQKRIITSLGQMNTDIQCCICRKTNCKKYYTHLSENFYYICGDCSDEQDYEE